MSNQRMIFDIDRRTVTEGDVVEVKWQCDEAESVKLTIDNGYRSTDIPLETSGNKRFRLNRSKGRTHLTITVSIDGKSYSKRIHVRVKKMPTVHAETVDEHGRRQGWLRQWWQKLLTNWHDFRARMRQGMQALPERKQLAAKMLAIMGVILILSAIWPRVYGFGMMILVAYLAYVMLKR